MKNHLASKTNPGLLDILATGNPLYQFGATDKPCGKSVRTLTKNCCQTIHEERDIEKLSSQHCLNKFKCRKPINIKNRKATEGVCYQWHALHHRQLSKHLTLRQFAVHPWHFRLLQRCNTLYS